MGGFLIGMLVVIATVGWTGLIHYRREYKRMTEAWLHTKDMLFKATGLRDK